MKKAPFIFLALLFALSTIWTTKPKNTQAAADLWQPVAEGIEYREFYLPGPEHAYVTRLDRSNPNVTLESSLAQGKLGWGLETVRDQAARYDQAINDWGEQWGRRSQVVAAINGSFFDTKTGVPFGGIVQSGWYAKRFDDRQTSSGFAWTFDRTAFIGGCVVQKPGRQLITHLGTGGTTPIDGLNAMGLKDALVVYTPQFDFATPSTKDEVSEISVEMSRPMSILPLPDMITGTVRQVSDGKGGTSLPFDTIVLSASGKARQELQGKLKAGDVIGVSQEIRNLDASCNKPAPQSWTKTYTSVGGSYVFLKDGVVQGLTELGAIVRNPRTAIAFNDRYIFFIVVDGRQPLRSQGMSMVELGQFARLSLGAAWGIAEDGGGSSTLVVNGEVKNSPNAELVDRPASAETPVTGATPLAEATTQPGTAAQKIERAVADGMMMVVVLPKEQSTKFKAGDKVTVSIDTNIRLGPGTNYAILSSASPNSEGVILAHPLDGVLAKGEYWWKAAFGETVGWIAESLLVAK